MNSNHGLISFLPALAFLFSVLACSAPDQPDEEALTRRMLESHKDSSAVAHEKYVIVKLPLTNGVGIWNPVQVVRGPDDVMYVANNQGEIFALKDSDEDGLEDTAVLFCNVKDDGLRTPASMEFRDGALYVGVSNEIRVYLDRDQDGRADSSYTFFNDVPYSEHPYEWTSGLTFDKMGRLYFVLTTDSWNASPASDPQKLRGSLIRYDGNAYEIIATGLRSVSSMGFDAHDSLFFIDNAGGGNPTEELNVARAGAFYGHNPDKFGSNGIITDPALNLTYDVAPSGIVFGKADSSGQDLFISYYGPGERWNRGSIGKIRITMDGNGKYHFEEKPFVTGLPKLSDIALGADGSLYVTQMGRTDYWYQSLDKPDGAVYRIIPAAWSEPGEYKRDRDSVEQPASSSVALGESLFVDRACNACHSVDGKTELLGPNLKDIALVYDRKELLEEILYPNKRIKPSMAPTRLVIDNGDVLIGRVVFSDENRLSIMVTGNKILDVMREQIAEEETLMKSLMYEGLLAGTTPEEQEALLDYLLSLSQQNE